MSLRAIPRACIAIVLAAAAGASPAKAQTAAPAAVPPATPAWLSGLPGYKHPEVTTSACKLVNSGRRDCVIPGMTAGRYLIRASGASMPVGAAPRQQLTIVVDNRNCAQAFDATVWTGKVRTITTTCEITILSDLPTVVSIVYADLQALKAAGGPEVTFQRLRWSGVLQMREVPPPRR